MIHDDHITFFCKKENRIALLRSFDLNFFFMNYNGIFFHHRYKTMMHLMVKCFIYDGKWIAKPNSDFYFIQIECVAVLNTNEIRKLDGLNEFGWLMVNLKFHEVAVSLFSYFQFWNLCINCLGLLLFLFMIVN